jgi:preprotein translocase subunit SecE
MIAKLKKFLTEVKAEFKKVSWSSRSEIISSTAVVFLVVFLLAVFIGIMDFILSNLIKVFLR